MMVWRKRHITAAQHLQPSPTLSPPAERAQAFREEILSFPDLQRS